MEPLFLLIVFSLVFAVGCVVVARLLVVAQPDEWLLRIRNGHMMEAGVGIRVWRRPGDVVARFTSTIQRVSFTVDALSSDRLSVSIEGFVLWSVLSCEDGPFRAFRKLGLVNLDAPSLGLKSCKHLMTTPQYRAFQRLLAAVAQRSAAMLTLDELLVRQDPLVIRLSEQLVVFGREMGIHVEQVEITRIRPSESQLLSHMAAATAERLREEAAVARLEADERTKLKQIESDIRFGRESTAAREQELERDRELRLAQLEHDAHVKEVEQGLSLQLMLAEEAKALEVAKAVVEREKLQSAARLDLIRREAEANRDAALALTSAEEQKSQGVRDHELSTLVAEKVGEALSQLPLKEARWVTIGADSPVGTLATLIGAARELTLGMRDSATRSS
ncbi:SPFH domain-containing protein [Planctomycetota bacterium]